MVWYLQRFWKALKTEMCANNYIVARDWTVFGKSRFFKKCLVFTQNFDSKPSRNRFRYHIKILWAYRRFFWPCFVAKYQHNDPKSQHISISTEKCLKKVFSGGSSEISLIQSLNFFQDIHFFTKCQSDKWKVSQSP